MRPVRTDCRCRILLSATDAAAPEAEGQGQRAEATIDMPRPFAAAPESAKVWQSLGCGSWDARGSSNSGWARFRWGARSTAMSAWRIGRPRGHTRGSLSSHPSCRSRIYRGQWDVGQRPRDQGSPAVEYRRLGGVRCLGVQGRSDNGLRDADVPSGRAFRASRILKYSQDRGVPCLYEPSKPSVNQSPLSKAQAYICGARSADIAELDPFLLFDDFRNDNPTISRRLSLASPPGHRDHHLRPRGRRGSRRQPRQSRHLGWRRAMDDRRQRNPPPGDAQGRRAGTDARVPALGQPAARSR